MPIVQVKTRYKITVRDRSTDGRNRLFLAMSRGKLDNINVTGYNFNGIHNSSPSDVFVFSPKTDP